LETSLASQVLGWRPEVALQEGLHQTIAYYREAGVS
jgi:nucleoside-diphosphate-sugar epimerase